jgi:hypothetical protein
MKVYVVRFDHADYGQGVSGVFATLAAAQAHVLLGWTDGLTPHVEDEGDDYIVYTDDIGADFEVIHTVEASL